MILFIELPKVKISSEKRWLRKIYIAKCKHIVSIGAGKSPTKLTLDYTK